ncbi:MAG: hypothetical protein NXI01_04205 [Gammaproteobacteria bacterium]|nr:hypothetical protein [Gammaproteobacteria bacterium]
MGLSRAEKPSVTRRRSLLWSQFYQICENIKAGIEQLDSLQSYQDILIQAPHGGYGSAGTALQIDALLCSDLKILEAILAIPAFAEIVNNSISTMSFWFLLTKNTQTEKNTAIFNVLTDDTLRQWVSRENLDVSTITYCKTTLDHAQVSRLLTKIDTLSLQDILDLSAYSGALKAVKVQDQLNFEYWGRREISDFLSKANIETCTIPAVRQCFSEAFKAASTDDLRQFFYIRLPILSKKPLFDWLLIDKTEDAPYLAFERLYYQLENLTADQPHPYILEIIRCVGALAYDLEMERTSEFFQSLNLVLESCIETVSYPENAAAQARILKQLSTLFVNGQLSKRLSRGLMVGLFVLAGTLVLAGLLALIPLSGTNALFVLLASIKLNAVIVAVTALCKAIPAMGLTPTSFSAFNGIVGGSMLAMSTFLHFFDRRPPTPEERNDAARNKLGEAITEYSDALLTP